ncbi:hypothetical protein FDUTEX481_00578 [Tolypothrix sp. PCC 7601]|nr:hypothetical protein FDUTEX481_00578 [Tolypothrix sp. PCC 7601]
MAKLPEIFSEILDLLLESLLLSVEIAVVANLLTQVKAMRNY